MSDYYYKFIRPREIPPRTPDMAVGKDEALAAINWIVTTTPDVVHYDLETTGLKYDDTNNVITTVGLASDEWVVGIDLMDVPYEEQAPLWLWLSEQKLAGFNLSFDAAWFPEKVIPTLNIVDDTSLWFRLLATEQNYLQNYSLETVADKVLLWPDEYKQKGWLKEVLEKYKLKKDEMWKLALYEPQGYTFYCAMDAEASYLASKVFQETVDHWGFESLRDYFKGILVPKIKRQIKASYVGVPVDHTIMTRNVRLIEQRMFKILGSIMTHEKILPYIEEYEQMALAKAHDVKFQEIRTYVKEDEVDWGNPHMYKIKQTPPEKCPLWCRPLGGRPYTSAKKISITNKNSPWPRFNFSSTSMMKWLIYEKWLEGEYDVWYRNPQKPKWGGLVTVNVEGRDYQLDLTDSGGLPTGGDILRVFGDVGASINEYKKLEKMKNEFLLKYLSAAEKDGRVHAQSKILGAATGRLSGGNSQE